MLKGEKSLSDLISRSALEKYIRDYKWEFALNSDFSKAMEMVDVQPTIEAVPVVHSDWKYYSKKGIAVCKNCSFERNLDEDFGRAIACPNCGADMRKGGAE